MNNVLMLVTTVIALSGCASVVSKPACIVTESTEGASGIFRTPWFVLRLPKNSDLVAINTLDSQSATWKTPIGDLSISTISTDAASFYRRRLSKDACSSSSPDYEFSIGIMDRRLVAISSSPNQLIGPYLITVDSHRGEIDVGVLVNVVVTMRAVNDPNRLLVERLSRIDGSFVAHVRDEAGYTREVRAGDIVSRRLGTAKIVDEAGVLVEEWDSNTGWKQYRLARDLKN